MTRPWEIPATALLDRRWNACLDLAARVPVSGAKVAAVWDESGPDRVLASLRRMAAGDEADAGAA
jgi:hypothetical protein